MKVVFLDALTLGDELDLKELEEKVDLTVYPYTKKDEVIDRSIDAEVIIANKVYFTKEVIDALPKLKLISITAVGLDNVDIEYADSKGIIVKNVTGYSTESVAQHTLASVLYFYNNQHKYDGLVKRGEWEASPVFNKFAYPVLGLVGKKWGIIGLGNIGKKVVKIAQSLDADIYYYSTSGKNKNRDYKELDLETLLKEMDIISIHCPLNDKTKNLITKSELELLKDDALIINVGRGGIINEDALVDKFKNSNIKVSLDVLEKEPIGKDSPIKMLFESDRILLTPHVAWAGEHAKGQLVKRTILNVLDYCAKQNPS